VNENIKIDIGVASQMDELFWSQGENTEYIKIIIFVTETNANEQHA